MDSLFTFIRVVFQKEGYCVRGPIVPHVNETALLDDLMLISTREGLLAINQDLQLLTWIPHNIW